MRKRKTIKSLASARFLYSDPTTLSLPFQSFTIVERCLPSPFPPSFEEVDETEPHLDTCTFSPFVAALGFRPDTDKIRTLADLSEFVNTADKSGVDIDMPRAYNGVGLGLLPDTDQFSSLVDLQEPTTSDDTLEVEMSPAFSPVPSSETGLLPDTDKLPTVADLTISTKKRYPITLSAAGPSTSSGQRYHPTSSRTRHELAEGSVGAPQPCYPVVVAKVGCDLFSSQINLV
jgi:hypothetical protein